MGSRRGGPPHDVVVLDSVINATTSLDYQHWVMTTVNALCAADGVVCLGTRSLALDQHCLRSFGQPDRPA
ncbi:hypothetical protein OG217_26855 [Streptomyces sp. NBC_01023]|uniref:hypothetical protein n=1 Tax=Streptomyces sp. NBC_01023 TaxID=2903724 RepID=UPI00386A5B6C|nr:hypothetical protein OG217_26855 [Streptomyces sp. NBC_01023]